MLAVDDEVDFVCGSSVFVLRERESEIYACVIV